MNITIKVYHLKGTITFTGIVTAVAPAADNPGCWSVGTNTAGVTAAFYLPETVSPSRYGDAYAYMSSYVRVPVLSDATNTFTAVFELAPTTSPSLTANHVVGIRYTHGSNSGKWEGYCKGPTATTSVDLGITVSTSATYFLEMYLNKQCTEARFFINGAYVGRVTANMPTTTNVMLPVIGLTKSVGTGSNVVYVANMKSVFIYSS